MEVGILKYSNFYSVVEGSHREVFQYNYKGIVYGSYAE